ncbi:cyclic AMP response element-binding protein A [Cimex lectularius]|uniref:BZIP domain-containing protein n=1 Tax=Cimex lectularius TaxID=79782 RepID=A0A8I6RCT8_CIMLE|nr:cyclic AMP response element-binding protein A [Cimex lectularius]
MDPFSIDKSFYEISSDLRDLWDTDMDSSMPEIKLTEDEWCIGNYFTSKSQVIIRDRLMSDAVLGDTPIKSEHSYCSLFNQNDSLKTRSIMIKEEMEDDILPTVEPKAASGRVISPSEMIVVKSEPVSHPASPRSECPSPPITLPTVYATIKPEPKTYSKSVLKPTTVLIKAKTNVTTKRKQTLNNTSKAEPSTSGFPWPPTPPSSISSDSEGNVSPLHPSSTASRLVIASTVSSRQPIQTTLISCQPKGSTGILLLTEEEKRTLLAEGYPIPVRLPLTKAEEKTLKKVRRKIKNKISAQESRRKKKEYMDTLEKKVQLLASENFEYKKKISSLEDINTNLLSQVAKLKSIIANSQK